MKYSALARRYFDAPPNVGVLSGPAVFRGAAGARAQGTWIQFDVQVAGAKLEAVRFLAFGCPYSIAVAAWVAEQASGRPLEPRLPEAVAALAARFELPVEKMGRLLTVEDAWLQAIGRAIDSAT